MKPIRLPEPPASPRAIGGGVGGMTDIFDALVYGAVRRAVVIGNGFTASENQSLGLVRALGLSDHHTLYVSSRFLFIFSTFCSVSSVENLRCKIFKLRLELEFLII